MIKKLKAFVGDKSGVTAIEYGLIAALVAVASISAFTALGGKLSATFAGISKKIVAPK